MKTSLRSVVVVSLILATVAVPTGSAVAGGVIIPPEVRLQAAIDSLVDRPDGPPGAIAVVQRRSKVMVFRAGHANLRSGQPMAPWMHMRIASTAKAYSGAAALSLVQRGDLSLDDTVGQWLPWTNATWQPVTLAQLLHHTSGVPDFTDSMDFLDAVIASPEVAPPPRELLSYVQNVDVVFTPGSQYEYSNSDNILVGLIVKRATQTPYPRVLRQVVTRPLDMHHTSLPRGVKLPVPFMHGYQTAMGGGLDDVTEDFAAGWAWASGGMVSTPLDQNRFIRAYVGRGLFDADTQALQFDFVEGGSEPTGPGVNAAGLGIFRYRTRCGTVYGHTGNTSGFTQFFAANHSGTRSAVVSINRQITQDSMPPSLFRELRGVFTKAVCVAMD